MSAEGVRFMRLFVFFDLPVKRKEQRRNANRFRNFLLHDGYHMIQLSVYSRVCRGQEAVEKHMLRLRASLPPEGCVRALRVTEKQYSQMEILVGKAKTAEKIATRELLLF